MKIDDKKKSGSKTGNTDISDKELEKVTGGAVKSGRPLFCSKCGKEYRSSSLRDEHEKTCKG